MARPCDRSDERSSPPVYPSCVETIRQVALPSGSQLELCVGDLAALTPEDGCDLLVMSLFPGDYTPTPTSLAGALTKRGIRLSELAADPEVDLLATTSCWLSRRLPRERFGFDRLLCYEPETHETAEMAVGDIFRTLVPFVGPEIRDVAMPIVASGDRHVPRGKMLRAILIAAQKWMEFGLPLDRLRIVVLNEAKTEDLAIFDECTIGRAQPVSTPHHEERTGSVFISYARADGREVMDEIRSHLSTVAPHVRTIVDVADIDVGAYWQTRIAELMESSDRIIFVVTDGFWRSKICLEEYSMARVLESERSGGVVFPIFAKSCDLPLHFKILNYEDCREADPARVRDACDRLVAALRA